MEGDRSSDDDFEELPRIGFKKKQVHLPVTRGPSKSVSEICAEKIQRISQINHLHQIDRECSDLMKNGSVLEHTQRVIEKHKEAVATSPVMQSPTTLAPTGATGRHETVCVAVPPGVPFFVKPIVSVGDFSNAPLQKLPLLPDGMIDSTQGLRDLITNKLLLLVFRSEPCPAEVLFWLLELSCLSCDYLVRTCAFSVLLQLVQRSELLESFFPEFYSHVAEIFIKLGASEERLLTFSSSQHFEEQSPMHNQKLDIEMLQSSVTYIVTFLKIACQTYQCVPEPEKYTAVLLNLALDPSICQSLVATHVWNCLETLISTADEDFLKITEVFTSALHVYTFSRQLINCAFILRSLPVTTQRLRQLRRKLTKQFLVSITEAGADNTCSIPDHQVALTILDHYLKKESNDIDYVELYCVMTVLSTFIRQPEMNWSTWEIKSSFIDNLTCLGTVRIRETALQAVEKGPVKDLIIRMKLNLQHETGKVSKQTKLFDYLVDSQD